MPGCMHGCGFNPYRQGAWVHHGVTSRGLARSWAALAALLLLPQAAFATDGYFANGIGARHKALAGAGVADGRDATSAALNPAGILRADNEFDMSVSLFSPRRQFEGSPPNPFPGFTPGGEIESNRNWFLVPNIARNWKTPGNPYFDAVTVSLSGNGGMNTSYGNVTRDLAAGNCFAPPPAPPGTAIGSQSGVFCFGKSGVDLTQVLLSVAMAKRFGNVSVGVAPTAAVQIFEARGLSAFGLASTDPANLTDNGHDVSYGGGLRAGIEWSVTPAIRIGVTGATPMWMTRFDEYRGLFADQGDFDIPANVQAGIAVDVTPSLTLMADYRRIWYSQANAIGNPSTNLFRPDGSGLLGAGNNAAGFGWDDVDSFKLGLEWRASPSLTLRAGYAYNTQPVQSRDVMFNILAPGVVQHHITGGFAYRVTDNMDLEFAAMYAPREHVAGFELGNGFGNPAHAIDISMAQYEATIGIKYRFDSPPPLK